MTLSANEISISLGGERVLSDISIGVTPGEVVTVVGPSGTGKTTLLRLLALFRRPDAGTITWDGTDVWSIPDNERLRVRRRLSMVFQEPSLFNASVLQNATYGLRTRRSWPSRIREGVERLVGTSTPPPSVLDALETVDLRDKADRNALSLSSGEAQRVAFARALAVDPEVMLLDEPTSNLDPRNTAILEASIQRACERGVGVIVATHDMHQAERISDRVGVILGGELIETGPPERIFESPSDPRTERFIAGELVYGDDDESEDPSEPMRLRSTPEDG